MSLPSKYPDHPCGKCGVTIKKGDQVFKIDATNQWCSNLNCPNPPTTTASTAPPATTSTGTATTITAVSEDAFVIWIREQIRSMKTIEEVIRDEFGTAIPGEKIGMYVKEIYRQQKLKENQS